MSPEDLIPGPDCRSEDVAAYALGALQDAEAAAFERHLQSCAVCPLELAAFQRVVDELALSAAPFSAPRDLRRHVMSAVADEPRGTRGTHPEPRPARAPRRWRPSLPLAALGSGMAFALAAIVVVILAFPGRQGNRTVAAQVTGSGSAALRISADHTELVLHRFPAPPRGKIYEVWIQHGSGKPRPTTALFGVNREGDASVDVPGSMYGVSRVMVTPEPLGGSRVPTHSPVITATVS